MSAHTDPIWTLLLWLAAIALVAYITVDHLAGALASLDRRNAEYDQEAAADFDEKPAMPPSLARYIAQHAAEDIDTEWAAICEATGGAA